MRVAIVGSRNPGIPYEEFAWKLRQLDLDITEVVSGGAKGIDTYARKFAEQNNIKLVEFLPEYEKYGRHAPIVRNFDIVEEAEMVVAFWKEHSYGTYDTICKARNKNKRVEIIKL